MWKQKTSVFRMRPPLHAIKSKYNFINDQGKSITRNSIMLMLNVYVHLNEYYLCTNEAMCLLIDATVYINALS